MLVLCEDFEVSPSLIESYKNFRNYIKKHNVILTCLSMKKKNERRKLIFARAVDSKIRNSLSDCGLDKTFKLYAVKNRPTMPEYLTS